MDQVVTADDYLGMHQVRPSASKRAPRVIAVTSGKGGVGKTNSVVNLAVAFSIMGEKVLLIDASLGLGNLDVLLGLTPKYNIGHLLRGEKMLREVLVKGPAGIMILPAASGCGSQAELETEQRLAFMSSLENSGLDIDIILIDTSPGISGNVLFFNMIAQETIVVSSPEPTSVRDAYALMKVLLDKNGGYVFRLLVNMARSERQGLDVYRNISDRFLDISLDYIGCVLHDENLPRAVLQQKPMVELYPQSRASVCFRDIAKEICRIPQADLGEGVHFFQRQGCEDLFRQIQY